MNSEKNISPEQSKLIESDFIRNEELRSDERKTAKRKMIKRNSVDLLFEIVYSFILFSGVFWIFRAFPPSNTRGLIIFFVIAGFLTFGFRYMLMRLKRILTNRAAEPVGAGNPGKRPETARNH